MRHHVNLLVKAFSEAFEARGPVVEIGSYQVKGQEAIANLRPYFPGVEYIGVDIRAGPGVDRVENGERLSFEPGSVGTMLSLETLEHTQNCFNAMAEAYRVLADDGILLVTSLMDFPIHDYPYDYWRFTPEAFNLLLAPFEVRYVGYEGDPRMPHTVFGVAVKHPARSYDEAMARFERRYVHFRNLRPPQSRISVLFHQLKYHFGHFLRSYKKVLFDVLGRQPAGPKDGMARRTKFEVKKFEKDE